MSPAGSIGLATRRPRHVVAEASVRAKFAVVVTSAAVVVATSAAVTYAPVPRLFLVLVPVGLAVAFMVFVSSTLAAVLLGASIPVIQDVTGGHLGLHVAASDVVLVLIGARLLADAAVSTRRLGILRALRPVRVAFTQYGWLVVVLLVLHLGLGSADKSVQRLELFLLPLFAGAFLALRADHNTLLRAYVLVTTLLAVVWPVLNAHGLEGQFDKNTVGQLIACAILLLIAVRGLGRLVVCLPVLVVGLALTASRGSVLAVVVGVAVLSVMVGGRSRRMLIVRTAVIVTAGLAIYQFLPGDVTAHFADLSGSGTSASAYNINIRYQYDHDAESLIAAHPWTGVGVGNYMAGQAALGTQTTDPHNVVLLEAGRGRLSVRSELPSSDRRHRTSALAPEAGGAGVGCGRGNAGYLCSRHGRRLLGARLAGARLPARWDGLWACGAPQIGASAMSLRPVQVVVVAYHGSEQLARALAGLERQLPVTVVDNSSSPEVASVAGPLWRRLRRPRR
jgi:hypothetical protein